MMCQKLYTYISLLQGLIGLDGTGSAWPAVPSVAVESVASTLGGKEMTLDEERNLEKIRAYITIALADKHSSFPHWDAAYPWKGNISTLPDNHQAVEVNF